MTKKQKSEILPFIYHIENIDRLSDKQMNELLLCGDCNWDFYFVSLVDKIANGYERIENVKIIEFENEKEMFAHLKRINPLKLLDYSTFHEKPSILKLV